MAIPLVDLSIKAVIEFGLQDIRANAKHHLPDIFCDATLPALQMIYGQRMIDKIEKWLSQNAIPVVLGWDLEPTMIPGITVALGSNGPNKKFLGDRALPTFETLQPQDKAIIVPQFSPVSLEFNAARTQATVGIPTDMPQDQQDLFLPGLLFRDARGQEFPLGISDAGEILLLSGSVSAGQVDPTRLEVISPAQEAQYRRGAMYYDEQVVITVHGSQNNTEGIWLWAMVVWILNRYRTLLTGTFGLDFSHPNSSDFGRQEGMEGTNVWKRFVQLGVKAIWDWEESRVQDVVGFLVFLKASGANQQQTTDLGEV